MGIGTKANTRVQQILYTFNAASAGKNIDLYQPGQLSPWNLSNVSRYDGYIRSLRLCIDITSLPEADIPELEITDSRVKKITAARDMEWKNPHKELELYFRNSRQGITRKAIISLLNRRPFYQINILKYLGDDLSHGIAADTIFSAAIVNRGFGFLSGNDTVSLEGFAKEEAETIAEEGEEVSHCTSYGWEIPQNQSTVILGANPYRKQATIMNTAGNGDVFLSRSAIAEVNKGIHLPKGAVYEIANTNKYKGPISIISLLPTKLFGDECV